MKDRDSLNDMIKVLLNSFLERNMYMYSRHYAFFPSAHGTLTNIDYRPALTVTCKQGSIAEEDSRDPK